MYSWNAGADGAASIEPLTAGWGEQLVVQARNAFGRLAFTSALCSRFSVLPAPARVVGRRPGGDGGVGVNHSLHSLGSGERLGTDTVTGRHRDDPVAECRGGERRSRAW